MGFHRFHYKPALDCPQIHSQKQYARRRVDDNAIIQDAIENFGNVNVVKILHGAPCTPLRVLIRAALTFKLLQSLRCKFGNA